MVRRKDASNAVVITWPRTVNNLTNVENAVRQSRIELLHCDLLFCLISGEEGHMSKDCETGPKTHTVKNEDGTTRGK